MLMPLGALLAFLSGHIGRSALGRVSLDHSQLRKATKCFIIGKKHRYKITAQKSKQAFKSSEHLIPVDVFYSHRFLDISLIFTKFLCNNKISPCIWNQAYFFSACLSALKNLTCGKVEMQLTHLYDVPNFSMLEDNKIFVPFLNF